MSLPAILLPSHNTKRDDLRCWRALSIIAVLLFHILPEQFPNGYLGVDIFFVLSGYLMASIYSFEKNVISSTIDFYFRRLKRILPIYLVVILITLILLSSQIFPEEYKLILEDSKWAIGLASNYMDILKKTEYFETKANFRFFRHCWSLAVEMQFYLIFPFFAITRNHISTTKYRLLLLLFLFGSLFYQMNSTNLIIQYESLFCRIWQFAFGMLAQTSTNFAIKWLPSVLLLFACVILFCSTQLPRLILSFIAIATTSGIIAMSSFDFHPYKVLLRHPSALKYFAILGDISYVIYLIHWPLITYSHLMSSQISLTYFNGFLLFMTSIFLSKIAHHIIEKPLLKVCNNYKNLSICLIILYASLIYIPTLNLIPRHVSLASIKTKVPSNLTLDLWVQALNISSQITIPPEWTSSNDIEFASKLRGSYMGGAVECKYKKTIKLKESVLQYCEVMGHSNGTLVGLSIGNSFAMNIVSAISSNPLFKKVINVFGNAAQFPIHDEFESYLVEKLIKPIRPDVTFLVQRYFQDYLYQTPIDEIHSHKEFQHWNNILQNIQNYTSAIILNKESLIFPYDISQDFIRRKLYGLPIETRLKYQPLSTSLEVWLNSLSCSKCQFFGYRDAFCEGNFCNIIDVASGLPVFRDTEHISPLGVRHLEPFIRKTINKALKF